MPEFEALIAARKNCRICVERSPGKIRSCAEFDFDPDVVSHWEQWLGHRRPKLLVVGQDFGNVGYFVRCRGRDEPNNKTNENLYRLLTAAGIAVAVTSAVLYNYFTTRLRTIVTQFDLLSQEVAILVYTGKK